MPINGTKPILAKSTTALRQVYYWKNVPRTWWIVLAEHEYIVWLRKVHYGTRPGSTWTNYNFLHEQYEHVLRSLVFVKKTWWKPLVIYYRFSISREMDVYDVISCPTLHRLHWCRFITLDTFDVGEWIQANLGLGHKQDLTASNSNTNTVGVVSKAKQNYVWNAWLWLTLVYQSRRSCTDVDLYRAKQICVGWEIMESMVFYQDRISF